LALLSVAAFGHLSRSSFQVPQCRWARLFGLLCVQVQLAYQPRRGEAAIAFDSDGRVVLERAVTILDEDAVALEDLAGFVASVRCLACQR
jgi:hypothetical protein